MKRKNKQPRSSKGPRRIVKSRALRYSSLTATKKAEYGRAVDLLYDLRHSGGTYTQLLRRHRLSTWKAHRYLGANLLTGKRGTRVQASKTDMLVRELMFPTREGDIPVLVRGLPAATRLSNFFLDRAKLLGGDIGIREFEAKWRGVRIGGRELFADGDAILTMADADIFDLEHLYSKVGPAR